MITYFIKTFICSTFLFLMYKMLLEKEKILTFNRLYLLGSLLLSFILPFITLPFFSSSNSNFLIAYNIKQSPVFDGGSSGILLICGSIYVVVTLLLLRRFCYNIYKIMRVVKTNPAIAYKKATIILIPQVLMPHSFLNYIFVHNETYTTGRMEQDILLHEYAHVTQKHSYDILLINILQAFFWMNPTLLFYKNAIQLNHEFLADEAVTKSQQDIRAYQYLLLQTSHKSSVSTLTSSFSYTLTKKRLLMLNKSHHSVLGKKLAVILCILFSVFFFTNKDFAQKALTNSAKGASSGQLIEYREILNRLDNEKNFSLENAAIKADLKRLEVIYLSMSEEQKKQYGVQFTQATPAK